MQTWEVYSQTQALLTLGSRCNIDNCCICIPGGKDSLVSAPRTVQSSTSTTIGTTNLALDQGLADCVSFQELPYLEFHYEHVHFHVQGKTVFAGCVF